MSVAGTAINRSDSDTCLAVHGSSVADTGLAVRGSSLSVEYPSQPQGQAQENPRIVFLCAAPITLGDANIKAAPVLDLEAEYERVTQVILCYLDAST